MSTSKLTCTCVYETVLGNSRRQQSITCKGGLGVYSVDQETNRKCRQTQEDIIKVLLLWIERAATTDTREHLWYNLI